MEFYMCLRVRKKGSKERRLAIQWLNAGMNGVSVMGFSVVKEMAQCFPFLFFLFYIDAADYQESFYF